MITIYLDTTQGIVVTIDEEDIDDEVFMKELIEEIAEAAEQAYRRKMGIDEIMQ